MNFVRIYDRIEPAVLFLEFLYMNLILPGSVMALSGCSSDIGQQIAAVFKAEGASVYGCDLKTASLDAAGFADLASFDLTDRAAARQWVDDVTGKAEQAIGILVHNAGGGAGQLTQPLENVSDDEWDPGQFGRTGFRADVCYPSAMGRNEARRTATHFTPARCAML